MDSVSRWGIVSRLLHWGIAALILFQLGLGLVMTRLVDDVGRQFALTQTHKSIGFAVFVLVLVRIGWRSINARPAPPLMPRWQARAAEVSHLALYCLMVALPVSGWLLASASPVQDLLQMQNEVFGMFALPDPFVPGSEALAGVVGRVHTALAVLLVAVLLLHGGAALKHQFVDHDGLLARMIRG